MNSPNLRVSTAKTAGNVKKNAELRTSIVVLPDAVNVSKDILKNFLEADSIPKQICLIKEINSSFIFSPEDKIKFLIELYFNSPLKHPVRCQCYKLLQVNSTDEIVILNFDLIIDRMLRGNGNLETLSCEHINFVVTSLSGCFENFRIAKETLKKHASRFLIFIHHSLQKYLQYVKLINSPSAKNELYLFIHNSVRVILLCVQEFFEDLENLPVPEIVKIRTTVIDTFKDILMPMDIKTNVGILLAYISQKEQKYDSWLDKIINYQPFYRDEYINNCFLLSAGVGVINTLKSAYLEHNFNKVLVIAEKIVLIVNKHCSESGMLLAGTRCLSQFSKTLMIFNTEYKSDEIMIGCELLFSYSFSYLDHHLDNVRHITKDLLKNILSICSKYKLNAFLDKIYMLILQNDISLSIKCILISSLAKVCGTQQIIEKRYKNILDDFFTTDNFERDIKVANCFESMVQASYYEMDLTKWKNIYINFLIKNINMVNEDHKHIYKKLLENCIKLAPVLTEWLLEDKLINLELSVKLSVLCTIRKNGLKSDCFNTLLQNIPNLKEAFLAASDDTKISALRLLAESHKSTEELTELECDNLLFCLEYNSNSQNPETRQKILSLSSKILTRFEINLKKIIKMGRHESEFRNLHFYYKFLTNLVILLYQNLFDGSNFSRRFVSLELLKKSLKIIIDTDLKLDNFLPENALNLTFLCLSDSYEINKALALDILKMFVDVNYGQFIGHDTLLKELLISVKPTDSVSAAYYLEFYCYVYKIEQFIKFFEIKQNLIFPSYEPVKFCALKMVMNILESGLLIGKKSILLAAVSNPFYGCLLTIKHILSKLDFDKLSQEDIWRDFVNDIIKLNKEASNIVVPIVNSSSPEGYFPHDFNEFSTVCNDELILEARNKINNFSSAKIYSMLETAQPTPQMVLICAWRTIKEVSLILGDLAQRSVIEKKSNGSVNYLLTHDQILEVGDHFKLLLSETKHRGAFEQAYVGFTKLCLQLWRVDQEELNILPMAWLTELMNIISRDDKISEKMCATRRSAGIPFMVQALITSELRVGTTKALKKCMQCLFEICYSKLYSTESKTHSLNILRALFRCTDLNEVCYEYVADGIICAVQGYDGHTWSERNSSTLLFAALITRIFGVQRTKDGDDLNIRNKMTGRIFFLRYPKLFDFFLSELKEAAINIKNNEKSNKLHPLLLVLSRLYPSALEGTECHLKVSSFISYISPCSASRDLQTRILISKAVVAFVSLDLIEERIYTILSTIKMKLTEGKGLNSNYFHGLLLQLLFVVKPLKEKRSCLVSDIAGDLLVYKNIFDLNPIIMRTIIQIFYEILKNNETCPVDVVKELNIVKNSQIYSDPAYSKYYPIFRKSFCIFRLQIDFWNYKKFSAESFWENQSYIKHKNRFILATFEEAETYLNIILLILLKNNMRFQDLITEFECHNSEIEFVNTLSEEFLTKSALYFKSSLSLGLVIQEFLELSERDNVNPILLKKIFAILSHINILKEYNIKKLVNYSKKYSSDLQNSIALTINSFLELQTTNIKTDQTDILQYSKITSQPWNNFSLRFTTSLILKHLFTVLVDNIKVKDEKFVSEFSSVILCMLMDDDIDIRESTSKHVLEFCSEYSSKYQNVISTFAQKIFIEKLIELLIKFGNYDISLVRSIFYEIIAILKGDTDKNYEEECLDIEVFDKNEINIFAEPQKVILDFSTVFYETFREQL